MKFKFVDILDWKPEMGFPEARVLTPEEEAQLLAQCKAEIDPAEFERELTELWAQYQRGELVDADDLLREIESGRPPRKPS